MKPIEIQLTYKKVIAFTNQQKESLLILQKYNVNVNEFIRIAVKEKIKRDWKSIKESNKKQDLPF